MSDLLGQALEEFLSELVSDVLCTVSKWHLVLIGTALVEITIEGGNGENIEQLSSQNSFHYSAV